MRWRAYLSILRIRLIASLQYRTAALAGMTISFFWGIMLVTILILFYELGHRQTMTMTLAQGVSYIWIGQCLIINLVPMQLDTEIQQKITSGDFAYELCRPLDLYTHWYVRSLAMRLANIILKSGITLVACTLLPVPYGIQPPVSFLALGAAVLALVGALLLSCAFTNLMNVLLLKVELGLGLNSLIISTVVIFSGLLIPLSVFPDWLQPILRVLPFAGLMDFPCALYTGIFSVDDVWWVFARQIIWIVVLVFLGRWGMERGLRRTVIQGG